MTEDKMESFFLTPRWHKVCVNMILLTYLRLIHTQIVYSSINARAPTHTCIIHIHTHTHSYTHTHTYTHTYTHIRINIYVYNA